METLERRTERLRSLVKACGIVFTIAAGTAIFLPAVTLGTTINEHAITFSVYFGLGAFLGPAYAKCTNLVARRLDKIGRNVDSPWFMIGLLGGIIPVGSAVYYLALRLFSHDGNWSNTLVFSWDTLCFSFLLNGLLACMVGSLKMISVHYRDGENIIFRNAKPSKFWHVIVLFVLTLAAPALMIFVSHLLAHSS